LTFGQAICIGEHIYTPAYSSPSFKGGYNLRPFFNAKRIDTQPSDSNFWGDSGYKMTLCYENGNEYIKSYIFQSCVFPQTPRLPTRVDSMS
jgi:hypothetical protein